MSDVDPVPPPRPRATRLEAPTSETMFEAILAIAADAIITIDESQSIRHFNEGAQQIFGYAADEVLGRSLDMLLPGRFRDSHAVHIARFAESPEPARRMGHRREIFGLRKGGDEFPAEASISKLRTAGGWMFTVVLRDISERKRLEWNERFIAEAGALLASSLDVETTLHGMVSLPVPHLGDIAIVDFDMQEGRTRRLASAASDPGQTLLLDDIAGGSTPLWTRDNDVSDIAAGSQMTIVDPVTPEWLERAAARPEDAATLARLGVESLMLVWIVAHGRYIGTLTFLSTDPRRRFDEIDLALAGKFAARGGLAADNARLYQAAQRLTRARDEILGIVSHDLRNPLSAIAMCTRVLLESPPADDAARRLLVGAIDESAEWMNRLIQDLLDVTSIDAGRLSLERQLVDVIPVIEKVTGMFGVGARERGIVLVADVPEPPPLVHADAERLVQVLANLVSNALKFTTPGGRVTIGATHDPSTLRIAVSDTGSGIPSEELPHIFDRYWHARRGALQRGSGLGLAIARGIVEAHGGTIDVTSTVGEGSTFVVALPIASHIAVTGDKRE